MRHCKRQRHPFDHLTRVSMVDFQNKVVGVERTLLPSRSAAAAKCEVKNATRALWRNWEWCMSRVCNSPYRYN